MIKDLIISHYRFTRFYLLSLSILFLLAIGVGFHVGGAQAKDDEWAEPINLSMSGAAAAPFLVADTAGQLHAFWQDTFSGYVYTDSADGVVWRSPAAIRVPFSEPPFFVPTDKDFRTLHQPAVVADGNTRLHAFWTNADGNLSYSRTLIDNVTEGQTGWTYPTQLVDSASAPRAVVGEDGRLHVTYIRLHNTPDQPAGIYYLQSNDGGVSWSVPVRLYESAYLRAVSPGQIHLQMVVLAGNIYVVWTDPLQDIVFYIHSSDNGETWTDPWPVDQREIDDAPTASGPAGITLLVDEQTVHLTWRKGNAEGGCSQYYQQSLDNGVTWQPLETVYTNLACATNNWLLLDQTGALFLLTELDAKVYLQGWNGVQWSDLLEQPPLSSFTNPQTFRPVSFNCLQPVVKDDNLLVIGCGTGTVDDTWLLSESFAALNQFSTSSPVSVWHDPVAIVTGNSPFLSPQSLTDANGRINLFWSQADDTQTRSGTVYRANGNGVQWQQPASLFTSPAGYAEQFAVGLDVAKSRSLMVWNGGEAGELLFSQVDIARGRVVSDWSAPVMISPSERATGWPDLIVDRQGVIYVAYAIPFNEDRGIYVLQSNDTGVNWSAPVQAFNGVQAGWEGVDQPQLAFTGSSTLHLLWRRNTTSIDAGSLALVYARSEDGGKTWSELESVTDKQVTWSDIIGWGDQTLHRAWIEREREQNELWYSRSFDNGLSWSTPTRISDLTSQVGSATLFLDAAGEPHIMQLVLTSNGAQRLLEWVLVNEHWQQAKGFVFAGDLFDTTIMVAGTADINRIGIIYDSQTVDPETEELHYQLMYMEREWNAPDVLPTPWPTLTPRPSPTPTVTPTPAPTPLPTPDVDFSQVNDTDTGFSIGPLSTGSTIGRLLIAIIPSILIVLVVFIIGLRMAAKK